MVLIIKHVIKLLQKKLVTFDFVVLGTLYQLTTKNLFQLNKTNYLFKKDFVLINNYTAIFS